MELRVLNYFLAIAREENFTKAAQQLHVTRPTLSRQIAQLEDELGVTLFVRSNHNIVLTEDGISIEYFFCVNKFRCSGQEHLCILQLIKSYKSWGILTK